MIDDFLVISSPFSPILVTRIDSFSKYFDQKYSPSKKSNVDLFSNRINLFSLSRLVWKMIDRNRSTRPNEDTTRREKTISWKIENRHLFCTRLSLDDDVTLNDGGRRLRR